MRLNRIYTVLSYFPFFIVQYLDWTICTSLATWIVPWCIKSATDKCRCIRLKVSQELVVRKGNIFQLRFMTSDKFKRTSYFSADRYRFLGARLVPRLRYNRVIPEAVSSCAPPGSSFSVFVLSSVLFTKESNRRQRTEYPCC